MSGRLSVYARLGRRVPSPARACGAHRLSIRMVFHPVPGNVDAPANPHPVVPRDVIEEVRERAGAPGPSHEPHVQADRHHLRMVDALGVEEPAFLDHQAARVGTEASRVPAERTAAGQACETLYGATHVRALDLLAHELIVEPAPA